MSRRFPAGLLLLLLGFLAVAAGRAQPMPAKDHVFYQRGDIPLLITAPHGGTNGLPGVAGRTNGTVLADDGTYELALLLNAELTRRLDGRRPYVVAAQFHRRYLDVNRPLTNAFETPAARPFYERYHGHIRASVAEIRAMPGGEGLLVDLHGQGRDATTIFRGTGNGVTVLRLLERQGEDALIGPDSLLGRLARAGHGLVPANTPPGRPPEDRSYNGGFTVRTYGSHQPAGIDAIQLELGSSQRRKNRAAFAAQLADAIVVAGERTKLWPRPAAPPP